jgi:hypothetical protein
MSKGRCVVKYLIYLLKEDKDETCVNGERLSEG